MAPSNKKARFIETDNSGIRGSGVIEPQSSAAFAPSAFTGGYAFSLSGVDFSGKPLASIGVMAMFVNQSSIPVLGSGALDVNDNGSLSCYPSEIQFSDVCSSAGPAFQKFSGTYSLGANGRGTASFGVLGFDGNKSDSTVFNFSLYAVSPSEFFLLSMDAPGGVTNNPVFSGHAIEQQLPSSTEPFQQGPTVLSWSGFTPKTSNPQAASNRQRACRG